MGTWKDWGTMVYPPFTDRHFLVTGIAETPGMRKTGYFPVFSTGPVTSVNIGDDPLKSERAKSFFVGKAF
jgi:hypothetical protein